MRECIFILLFFPFILFGQLTTNTNSTPIELIENVLVGSGVTISNVVFTGAVEAIGEFNGANSNINISNGIIMSSGTVLGGAAGIWGAEGPVGPNNSGSGTTDWGRPGDSDLELLVGQPTFDAAILEFDFIPKGDSVEFEYVFASEEYPEFVFSGFNDVFAFLISGPGISGVQNLAIVPGTTNPVSINEINENLNLNLYVSNGDGLTEPQFSDPKVVSFDGFTTPLKAVSKVIPCQTYHLKIAIADAGDGAYDSGVFLEGGSLTSNPKIDLKQKISLDMGIPNGIREGCSSGSLDLTRTDNISSPLTIDYRILGSATNGVDYNNISSSITFPVNAASMSVDIILKDDEFTEGNETLIFRFASSNACSLDSIDYVFSILDNVPITSEPDTIRLACINDNVSISPNITGGNSPFNYLWNNGNTNMVLNVKPTSSTNYSFTVSDVCSLSTSNTVMVEVPAESKEFVLQDDTTICPVGSATIEVPNNLQQMQGASWTWINNGLSNTSYTVSNQPNGSIVKVILDITDQLGCKSKDTTIVKVDNVLPINITDISVCDGASVEFNSGYPSNGYTFQWQDGSMGNTFNLSNATKSNEGIISLSILSDQGCFGDKSVNLGIYDLPNPQLSNEPICAGAEKILDHGLIGVNSIWDHGKNTNPIVETLPGSYKVTVTDDNNCSQSASVILALQNPPLLSLPSDQTLCDGESYLLETGINSQAYSHQWFGGSIATASNIIIEKSGEYRLNITDLATSCVASDTINFTFLEIPIVELGDDTVYCGLDFATLSSSVSNPDYTFNWNDISSGKSFEIDASGDYWLEITNQFCYDRDSISVIFSQNPVSELIADTILCFTDSERPLLLNAGVDGETFLWSTGDTSRLITVNERGVYNVTIEDTLGCLTEDYIEIMEDCPSNIWLPNVFTANNNNLNDVWTIQGRDIYSLSIFVFDRWGKVVWEGRNLGEFWDGTHYKTGAKVQQSTYIYKLKYSFLNVNGFEEKRSRIGKVTLIR